MATDLKNYVNSQVTGVRVQLEELTNEIKEENSTQVNEMQY